MGWLMNNRKYLNFFFLKCGRVAWTPIVWTTVGLSTPPNAEKSATIGQTLQRMDLQQKSESCNLNEIDVSIGEIVLPLILASKGVAY